MTTDDPEDSRSEADGPTRNDDGFLPLEGYGVLGDGLSAALIAGDGSVDWWAAPRLDSPPVCAALLDPIRGGRVSLRPKESAARSTWGYIEHSNQIRTTWTTSSATVHVTASLNCGSAGPLPWSELAFRLEGAAGTMEFELSVRPGDGLRSWEPWSVDDRRGPLLHAGPMMLGVRAAAGTRFDVDTSAATGRVTVSAGQRHTIGIELSDAEALYLCDVEAIDRRIDTTTDSWEQWCRQVVWDGADRERVLRSALALKTLVMTDTGAIAAAATTSLPERVGGEKNWDYRFSWVRDAAFTVDALAVLGLQEEVHAAVTWLLRAVRRNGLQTMYTLRGDVLADVAHPDVPGYEGSRPVMTGNAAATQRQLGIYGDLFGTVADWVHGGHVLDVATARELADLADRCADEWRRDDAGLWELPDQRPYTISKMNCWRALDAAARLADDDLIPGVGARWRGQAELVARWVQDHCWSGRKQAYSFYAGSDDLDAAVLLGAQTGFDTGARMSSTVDAVTAELGSGPTVYRYSGMQDEEGAFTACAFWRAHALVRLGRVDEARRLMTQLEGVFTPLGLMTEMTDPAAQRSLGNLPQALSHLAYIKAAAALADHRTNP